MLLLTMGSLASTQPNDSAFVSESSKQKPPFVSVLNEKIHPIFRKITEDALYLSAGELLRSASLLARVGWGVLQVTPWASTAGNECALLSHVCNSASMHLFAHLFKGLPSFINGIPLSHSSWHLNKELLSQVPAFSNEEKQLIDFLEKRWLAKSTGLYSILVDWICPCFGIFVQVHPKTTNSYARDPWNKLSQVYSETALHWKQSLPHPQEFPLILTRPQGLQEYLPSYLDVPQGEMITETLKRLTSKIQTPDSKVVVDLTQLFTEDLKESKQWLQKWNHYAAKLSKGCKECDVDPSQIVCIQRIEAEEIGAIRLLPLQGLSTYEIDQQNQFLLKWVSKLGLSANRIELDRLNLSTQECRAQSMQKGSSPSKEEFINDLISFDNTLTSDNPQKNLMLKGTLQVLRGLFAHLTEDKWMDILHNPTRSAIVEFSFLEIEKHLQLIAEKKDGPLFYDATSHLEQIHAHLTALLEIFAPFTADDFPHIYRDLLTSIPENLKQLTTYGIHSSGMTSLAGIFKAVGKNLKEPPRVLYGENTYFEIIHVAEMISNATPIDEATDTDWKEVDLILAQFNPVLKRIDFDVTGYQVEKIAEALRKSLNARDGKPLTLALDSTLDYINSPKVQQLVEEFQDEIEKGNLNIVCYRSGLKFDLFGMDNYCGAPFYMMHNHDTKWAAFEDLLKDPALLTDHLSLNWFCLAYKYGATQLEQYLKQVFDNTRAALSRAPPRLLTNSSNYRIIPVEKEAEAVFIDMKVFGPLHQMRASLVGGYLSLKFLEKKHPIFNRPSLGFYHPNFSMLFSQKCSTIRLTLGLDPSQVDLLAECFEVIDSLNGD